MTDDDPNAPRGLADGEDAWVPLYNDGTEGWPKKMACRRHGVIFAGGGDPCRECIRSPTLPPDVERPDYWRRVDFPSTLANTDEALTWQCEQHGHGTGFTDTQGCRVCLQEDGLWALSDEVAPGFTLPELEAKYGLG